MALVSFNNEKDKAFMLEIIEDIRQAVESDKVL